MTGILGLLIGGGSGFPASTHAMSVGQGGLYSFFTYAAYGFAVDAYGHFYNPGSGVITPSSRQSVQIAEISYYTTSIGGYGINFDMVWTTTSGLASQLKLDGVSYLLSDPGTVASTNTGTPTISIATPGVVTLATHGLTNGSMVMFRTTGALPTGLLPEVVYFVVGSTTNTFNVAATSGGAAIATSGTQSGTHTVYYRPRRRFGHVHNERRAAIWPSNWHPILRNLSHHKHIPGFRYRWRGGTRKWRVTIWNSRSQQID